MKFFPQLLLTLLFAPLPLVAQDVPPLLTELQLEEPGPYFVDYFGDSLSISGDTLAVGIRAGVSGPKGLVHIYERHSGGPNSWGRTRQILNPIPNTTLFGRTVALDGDTLVVGLGIHNLEVHVLERNLGGNNAWGVAAQLVPSDMQYIDQFGIELAIQGDTIVVGAHYNNNSCCNPPGVLVNSGAAFVYERNLGGPNQWGEAQILKASDERSGHAFGNKLAIDGETIVVGTHRDDHACPGEPSCNSGAAYVFEFGFEESGSWSERTKLVPSDIAEGDLFGVSVDISGETIIVGAPAHDNGCQDTSACNFGAVFVFERDQSNGAWVEAQRLAKDSLGGGGFGVRVSIDNNKILTGATISSPGPIYDPSGLCEHPRARCGVAYIFERDSSELPFGLLGFISAEPPPEALRFNFFGSPVAVQGDLLIAGATRSISENGAPGSVYLFEPERPPLSTLFTHYPLDDGDGEIASDVSGNGNDGSLVGTQNWTDDGMQGGALSFDGIEGHVEIMDRGSYSALDAEEGISIAAWVRPDVLGGTQMLVSKDDTYELELGLASGDSYSLRLGNVRIGKGNSPIEAGQWQHLMVTWDGSKVRYYKNARPDGSLDFSTPLIPNNNALGLGARPRNGIQPATYFLAGSLDEVYIFNRALGVEDVVDLFASSVNVDLTNGLLGLWQLDEGTGCSAGDALGNYDGTLGANCPEEGPQWAPGQVGEGLLFDTPGDQVTIPASDALSSLSAFTVAAWIRSTPTGNYQAILDQRDAGNDGYDLYVEPGSRLFLRVNDSVLVGSKTVADGQWHHVAAAYDGSQLQLFVDGVLDAQSSASAGSIATTASLRLGHHFSSNDYTLQGHLDEVYLHDRALSKLEIATLFLLGQSP